MFPHHWIVVERYFTSIPRNNRFHFDIDNETYNQCYWRVQVARIVIYPSSVTVLSLKGVFPTSNTSKNVTMYHNDESQQQHSTIIPESAQRSTYSITGEIQPSPITVITALNTFVHFNLLDYECFTILALVVFDTVVNFNSIY